MHNTYACTDPTATTAPTWNIHTIIPATLAEASNFVNASRKELFPSLGHDTLLDDPSVLETSCVLIARDENNTIIAAIAYTPFNYRFPHLPWPIGTATSASCNAPRTENSATSSVSSSKLTTANSSSSSLGISFPSVPQPTSNHPYKIVEVVRLFVIPQYRRYGLAASLFSTLRDHALESGVQCMYLHTHPFLPGAVQFWEKQGFNVICVDEEDEVWRTHHMQLMLE